MHAELCNVIRKLRQDSDSEKLGGLSTNTASSTILSVALIDHASHIQYQTIPYLASAINLAMSHTRDPIFCGCRSWPTEPQNLSCVHLKGVYFMVMHLIVMHVTGMCLMSVYLIDVLYDPPPYKPWSICRDLSCKIRTKSIKVPIGHRRDQ